MNFGRSNRRLAGVQPVSPSSSRHLDPPKVDGHPRPDSTWRREEDSSPARVSSRRTDVKVSKGSNKRTDVTVWSVYDGYTRTQRDPNPPRGVHEILLPDPSHLLRRGRTGTLHGPRADVGRVQGSTDVPSRSGGRHVGGGTRPSHRESPTVGTWAESEV